VVTDLLRQRLGYAGVVVSDDLQMRAVTDHYPLAQAVRLAVDAGVDILLFGNNLAYDPDIAPKAAAILRRLVDEGAIPRQRIERSYDRIMALKARLPRHETTGRTP
jgi:beta-N-acetylhexosaminidase